MMSAAVMTPVTTASVAVPGGHAGLLPPPAEESDDATAHVPLGEVNVRHGRGILQSVAKLIGNGLRAAIDLGFEPALANRGDRARSYHLLVTVEKGFDMPVLVTSGTAHQHKERQKDYEDGQRKTVHRLLLSSMSRRRIPKHQAAKHRIHRWSSFRSLKSCGTARFLSVPCPRMGLDAVFAVFMLQGAAVAV